MNTVATENGIRLSGNWNLSGIVPQIESLTKLHQRESGMDDICRIDCSDIRNVDMSGLQLLHVWIQCVAMRGKRPELVNLPEGVQKTIRNHNLERCFSDYFRFSECAVT